MSLWGRSCVVVLSVALGGCFFSSSEDGYPELDDCRGGATDDQVADTVVIAHEYADSLHEMVACGGLNVALCNGVIEGIINAIIEQSTDATPSGWVYQGNGTYVTMSEGATMETRFYVARDFSFAAAGELVTEDVFLIDNYLVNAVVAVDFSTGRTDIQYESVGPLVELLGQGANPPNPLRITLGGLGEFQREFRALEFESDVVLDDVREHATVRYHVVTPRLATQALVVDEWTIEFVGDGGGKLDGSSRYHVDGRHFDFAGETRFESSANPETTLSCG